MINIIPMGFINIGGQNVHTSALSNSSSGTNSNITICNSSGVITTNSTSSQHLVYAGSTMNYSINKTTYHVLGEDIEVEAYTDVNLAVIISTLNVLGKPFYDELKKNKVSFPVEIEEFLVKKFIILERDRKINDVLIK